MSKKVIIAFVTLLLILMVLIYFVTSKKLSTLMPVVEITDVKQGDLEIVLESIGELTSMKSEMVSVASSLFTDYPITEIQIETLVPEGSMINSGDLIATLDESGYNEYKAKTENDIAALKSNIGDITNDSTNLLKDVKLAFRNAKIDCEIKKIAVDQAMFDPPATQDRLQLEYKKSLLVFEDAQKNYQNMQSNLIAKYAGYQAQLDNLLSNEKLSLLNLRKMLDIKSTVTGIISYAANANGIKKNVGSSLTIKDRNIASVEAMSVLISNFTIEEDFYSKIKTGQKIKTILKTSGEELDATIISIDKQMKTVQDKKCFSIGARVNLASDEFLLHQTTTNRITLPVYKNALYLPNSSVIDDGGKSYVLTEDGQRHQVYCIRGHADFTIITSGLTIGQKVYLDIQRATN